MAGEESTAPVLRVGGSSFRCVEETPSEWSLMRLAAKGERGDDAGAAALYNFVMDLLVPDERDRFDRHMDEHRVGISELNNAIGDLVVEMAGRGKERARLAAAQPQDRLPGTSSAGSQAPASLSHRVVSLSQGTVQYADVPDSSTA